MYKIYKQIIFLLLALLIGSSHAAQATLNRCFRITSSQRTISLFAQKRRTCFPWESVLYPIKKQTAYVSYISSGKMKTNHLFFASGGCHLHPYSTLQESQNIPNPQYDKESLKSNLYASYSDFFVPCPELLTQIREAFTVENASGKNRYVILHGWIGSGKTTLAQHYGYTHLGKPYEMVWWIDATSAQTIKESLRVICVQFGGQDAYRDKAMYALHEELQIQMSKVSHNPDKRWLVIWDNVNTNTLCTFETINKNGFPGLWGDILMTTRDFTLLSAHSLWVDALSRDSATALFCHYHKPISEDERNALVPFIETTKGLPLALAEAGTYIKNTGDTFSHYINLRQKIISEKKDYWGKVANYSQNSLLRKEVEGSLARATQIAAEATRLMHLLAYYDYRALSKEVLLQAIIPDEFSCSETIFALQQQGLLYRNPATSCLETHPVYQQLLRRQDQAHDYKHLKEAATILRTLWESEPQHHKLLTPHVDACAAYLMEARHNITDTPDSIGLANVTLPQSRTIKQLSCSPLIGHTDTVYSVALTTDNQYIVSGSEDETIRIWDFKTGKEVSYSPLTGHKHWVRSVVVTTDNKYIVSGSEDETIRIWDLRTGEEVSYSPLKGHTNWVNSVAITTDNKYIVSGSYDKTIRIWDFKTGKEVSYSPLTGHKDWVRSVVVTTDNKYIVSGSEDETICIWDLRTGEEVSYSPLKGHNDSVRSVAVTTDNNYIVSSGGYADTTIRIWDFKTGKEVSYSPLKGHTNWVNSVAITTDNKYIVSGSVDNTIRIWDLSTGEEVSYSPLKGHNNSVRSVAVTTDNKYIISGSDDQTIRIWDINTGKEANHSPLKGHDYYVNSVAVTTDNKYIVSGSVDDTIRIWDLNTGKQVNHSPLQGHTSWVNSLAVTTDNKYIVSRSYDKTIRIWDLSTGKEVLYRPLKGHTSVVNSLAVTTDNKYLVSGSADKTIRIWDLNTGKETNNEPK